MTGNDRSRALVPLAPVPRRPTHRQVASRPAAFLAHLIAVKEKHPQTRDRRRAEPAEAIPIYKSAMAARPMPAGTACTKSR